MSLLRFLVTNAKGFRLDLVHDGEFEKKPPNALTSFIDLDIGLLSNWSTAAIRIQADRDGKSETCFMQLASNGKINSLRAREFLIMGNLRIVRKIDEPKRARAAFRAFQKELGW